MKIPQSALQFFKILIKFFGCVGVTSIEYKLDAIWVSGKDTVKLRFNSERIVKIGDFVGCQGSHVDCGSVK